jgi:hypothetical protein
MFGFDGGGGGGIAAVISNGVDCFSHVVGFAHIHNIAIISTAPSWHRVLCIARPSTEESLTLARQCCASRDHAGRLWSAPYGAAGHSRC